MHADNEESIPLLNTPSVEQSHSQNTKSDQLLQREKDLATTEEALHEINHKIQLDDSLEGLSLQYGVSISRIKHRNNLQSNEIYYLKELIIPDPKCMIEGQRIDPAELLRIKQEYAINGFMNELQKEDRSYKVARYYLEQANWDIYKAAQQYREDCEWEKNNAKHPNQSSPVLEQYKKHLERTLNLKQGRPQPSPINYQNIELSNKKTK